MLIIKFFIILLTSIFFIQRYNVSYASFYSVEDDFYDARPDLYHISNVDINFITNVQELDELQIEYHQKLTNLAEELKKLNETPVSNRDTQEYISKSLKVRAELPITAKIIDWLLARREMLERRQHKVSSNVIDEFNKKNN